jgi:hypothetical protein
MRSTRTCSEQDQRIAKGICHNGSATPQSDYNLVAFVYMYLLYITVPMALKLLQQLQQQAPTHDILSLHSFTYDVAQQLHYPMWLDLASAL